MMVKVHHIIAFIIICFGCGNSYPQKKIMIRGEEHIIQGNELLSYNISDSTTCSTRLLITNSSIIYTEVFCTESVYTGYVQTAGFFSRMEGAIYSIAETPVLNKPFVMLVINSEKRQDAFINNMYYEAGNTEHIPSSIVRILCRDKTQAFDLVKELSKFVTLYQEE